MGSGCFKNIADIADFNFAHVASSKFAGSVGFASENKKEHEKQNPSVHFVQIMAKERTFLASKLQYASLFLTSMKLSGPSQFIGTCNITC